MKPSRYFFAAILVSAAHFTQLLAEPSAAQDQPDDPLPSAETAAADLYGDALPPGAVARLGTVRYRIDGMSKRLTFVSNDRLLAHPGGRFGGGDVELIDVKSGRVLKRIKTSARDSAVSVDGKTVIVLSTQPLREKRQYACEVKLLDMESGKVRTAFQWNTPFSQSPERIAVSPDGSVIVVTDSQGHARILDVASEMEILSFKLADYQIESLTFSADGRTLAAGTSSELVVWDWASGSDPEKLPRMGQRICAVQFSPDGKRLAVCLDFDLQPVRMWDVAAQKYVWLSETHEGFHYPQAIAFTPDGRFLAVPVDQRGMRVDLYDAGTGKVVRRFDADPVSLRSVAVSPDGELLAASSNDNSLFVWRLKTGESLHARFVGHHGHILRMTFSPDGKRVVSGGYLGTVRVWDVDTGRELHRLRHENQRVGAALDISPDGALIASAGFDRSLRIWDAETGKQVYKLPGHGTLGAHATYSLRFTPDSSQVVSFGNDLQLRRFDLRTGKAVAEHSIRPSSVRIVESEEGELSSPDSPDPALGLAYLIQTAELSHDADELFLSASDTITIFNAAGVETGRVTGSAETISKYAVSPDGKMLALLDRRETPAPEGVPGAEPTRETLLLLRQVEGDKVLQEVTLPFDSTRCVAFSPQGDKLAIAGAIGWDYTAYRYGIFLWDVEQARECGRVEALSSVVGVTAFSQDSKRLATAHKDTTIVIWDLDQFVKEVPK